MRSALLHFVCLLSDITSSPSSGAAVEGRRFRWRLSKKRGEGWKTALRFPGFARFRQTHPKLLPWECGRRQLYRRLPSAAAFPWLCEVLDHSPHHDGEMSDSIRYRKITLQSVVTEDDAEGFVQALNDAMERIEKHTPSTAAASLMSKHRSLKTLKRLVPLAEEAQRAGLAGRFRKGVC